MASRFCPNCGCELSDATAFCGKCGTKIEIQSQNIFTNNNDNTNVPKSGENATELIKRWEKQSTANSYLRSKTIENILGWGAIILSAILLIGTLALSLLPPKFLSIFSSFLLSESSIFILIGIIAVLMPIFSNLSIYYEVIGLIFFNNNFSNWCYLNKISITSAIQNTLNINLRAICKDDEQDYLDDVELCARADLIKTDSTAHIIFYITHSLHIIINSVLTILGSICLNESMKLLIHTKIYKAQAFKLMDLAEYWFKNHLIFTIIFILFLFADGIIDSIIKKTETSNVNKWLDYNLPSYKSKYSKHRYVPDEYM